METGLKTQETMMVNVSRIQPVDYESIIQSLITSTDVIWLQALVMDFNDQDMVYKIEELMEPGLISLWDYEKRLSKTTSVLDRVITLEEYGEADQYTAALVSEMSKEETGMVPSDFTTWNIEKKNTFSNLIIAQHCGAESLLQRATPQRASVSHQSGAETNIFQLYANSLFYKTDIQSLSTLTIDQILELRRLSTYFRHEIQKCVDKHLLASNIPLAMIHKDCEELSRKYCETVNNIVESNYSTKGLLKGLALDLTSCLIEPLSYFQMGQKIYDLVFKRKQRGFIMYLTKLKKYTR